MDPADRPGPTVAKVFDAVAETYDQSGVAFFRPVAARLVDLLRPVAGERALDIGCGRGAATAPLARAVGPDGRVTAIDASPAMVAATRQLVDEAGWSHVEVEVGDATDLGALGDDFDVVASSLVLFFLPAPDAALAGWVGRLAPGGRIGLTTFGPLDEATAALDDLLVPHQPPALQDARTSGMAGPFASDAGMEDLLSAAGARAVRTVVEPAVLEFPDVGTWFRFSMATGQRAMWQNIAEEDRPAVLEQAATILDATRDGGPARLVWQMRYTLGER